MSIESNQTVISLAMPFEETEAYNGENRRAAFKQFLKNNGRADLIPAKWIAGLQLISDPSK